MSEVVPTEATDESQAEVVEMTEQATPDLDVTTWRKRLAGKDQALTATQRERDAIKAERDALAAWKADKEGAELTEVQRLQQERDRLLDEAKQAKAEAAAVRLAAQYPLAAEVLGEDLTVLSEARVAELNGRLATEKAEESVEPRIDANSPRRTPNKPGMRTRDDVKSELVSALKAEFGG